MFQLPRQTKVLDIRVSVKHSLFFIARNQFSPSSHRRFPSHSLLLLRILTVSDPPLESFLLRSMEALPPKMLRRVLGDTPHARKSIVELRASWNDLKARDIQIISDSYFQHIHESKGKQGIRHFFRECFKVRAATQEPAAPTIRSNEENRGYLSIESWDSQQGFQSVSMKTPCNLTRTAQHPLDERQNSRKNGSVASV